MPDVIADVMLTFCHFPMLFFITLLGSLCVGRALFLQTACLIALDVIVNVTLKGSFKVALSPALHKVGYALPSGHMQMATVFYMWWAYIIPFWSYRLISAIILCGVGAGLIHYGYHDGYDVAAGFFFGVLLVFGYHYTLAKQNKYFPSLLFAFSSGLMLCNMFLYNVLPIHVCIAYGSIILLIMYIPWLKECT
jgi:hypothetical protein